MYNTARLTQDEAMSRPVFYEFPFIHSVFEDHILNRKAMRVRAKGHYLSGSTHQLSIL